MATQRAKAVLCITLRLSRKNEEREFDLERTIDRFLSRFFLSHCDVSNNYLVPLYNVDYPEKEFDHQRTQTLGFGDRTYYLLLCFGLTGLAEVTLLNSFKTTTQPSMADASMADDVGDTEGEGNRPPEKLIDVLRHYGLEKYAFLSVGQMNTLALKIVQSEEVKRYRPKKVQDEINDHHAKGENGLHNQVYNEIACILDYIVKLKANIVGITRLLREGSDLIKIMSLPDEENGDRPTPDVFAFVPPEFTMQICQGMANQLFSEYDMLSFILLNSCPCSY